MSLIHALILAIIEGFTEFLPISSTGHLILASRLLGIETTDFTKTFEIVIQLGAIMAIVVLYFRRFMTDFDLYKKLFVAFIPTAIVGFILYPFIKSFLLGSSSVTLITLFVGGLILLIFNEKNKGEKRVGYKEALIIGAFQSISVIPGVSRAAATIIGGLMVGLNRTKATEFSFLLAVPTMLAASGLDIYKSREILMTSNLTILLFGTFMSFVFALIAVKFLVNYVEKHDFKLFGLYRILLALAFWIFVR